MSAAPAIRRFIEPLVTDHDQRTHTRYPIALELQYKVMGGGRTEQVGVGRTVNISSRGVLFEADDAPDEGSIEVAMNWPFLLDDVCYLKLIMRGHIVRRSDGLLAMKVAHHEFRTAGVVSQAARPSTDRGAS